MYSKNIVEELDTKTTKNQIYEGLMPFQTFTPLYESLPTTNATKVHGNVYEDLDEVVLQTQMNNVVPSYSEEVTNASENQLKVASNLVR